MKKLLPIIFLALCCQFAIAQPIWLPLQLGPVAKSPQHQFNGYTHCSGTAYLSDGTPVMAYTAVEAGVATRVVVLKWDLNTYQWMEFGTDPDPQTINPAYEVFNATVNINVQLKVDVLTNFIYLAVYNDISGTVVVRMFDGTVWGSRYISPAITYASTKVSFDLEINPITGIPYLAICRADGNVAVYDCFGASQVGLDVQSGIPAGAIDLSFTSTQEILIAYTNASSILVERFNGISWVLVGGGAAAVTTRKDAFVIEELGTDMVLVYLNSSDQLTAVSSNGGPWGAYGGTPRTMSNTTGIIRGVKNNAGSIDIIASRASDHLPEALRLNSTNIIQLFNTGFNGIPMNNMSIASSASGRLSISAFDGTNYFLFQTCENSPPILSTPPSSVGPLCAGSNANFTAVATGFNLSQGPLFYEWFLNGTTSIALGENLTVFNVAPGDESNSYNIVVTDHCGLQTSSIPVSITGPISAITLDAGADLDVCAGASVGIGANISGGTPSYTHNWSSISGGTLNSVSTLTPLFTAGTIAGVNILTLTSTDNNGCTATDDVQITVLPIPLVNAGADQSLCITSGSLNLAGSSTGTSFLWSGGSGTYTNNTLLNPQYIPSASDYTTPGQVTFTLTGINGPCLNTDAVTFTIEEAPILFAGTDVSICATSTPNIPLTGSILQGNPSVFWSTSGAGTIANSTSLSTTYTFTTPERAGSGGTIVFTLNALAGAICPATSDAAIVTYEGTPTLNPGTDVTICGDRFELSTAITTPTKGVFWTSSSSGAFIPDDRLLNPTYLISPADIATGSVDLTLNSVANICPTTSESFTLTLNNATIPTINAGSDQVISTTNATINGVLSGAGTLSWSSTGTGSFTAANSATPIYTFSAEDQNEGMVAVFAKVIGNAPCENYFDLDTLILRFDSPNSISGTIARANARMVLLKKLNGFFEPVNIITAAANGSYTFDKVGTGEFLIYYFDENNRAVYNGSVTDWKAASPIVISTGSSTVNISALTDITLTPSIIAQYLSGNDRIVGTVLLNFSSLSFVSARTADAGDEKPLQDATVYLLTEDGTRLGSTTTDANGTYSFSGLNGETYSIAVEYPSTVYDVPPPTTVTLDGDAVTVDAVNAAMIKSRAASTQPNAGSQSSYHNVNVYPNPAQDFIELKGLNPEEVTELAWLNVSGQVVFKSEFIKLSAQSISVSVPNLETGTYLLKWKEAGLTYSAPVVIRK